MSDEDRGVATAYGASRDAGDEYAAYPRRISYLVDPDGVIQRAYEVSDVSGHADEVIADLEELSPA